jgi:predicted metal-binding protein
VVLDKVSLEGLAGKHGVQDFRWISGSDLQVRQWVRFKCMFGCSSYGKKAACPPAVPSVSECRELFAEYDHVLVLQISAQVDPDDLKAWSKEKNQALLQLERDVFLAGHHKALLLFMDECRLCEDCPPARAECRNPSLARPCPEAMAVDVFSTARSAGFPIEVLTGYQQEMKRYAFLLVE